MIRLIGLATLGLALVAVPLVTDSRADEGSGNYSTASVPPAGDNVVDGGFEMLSAGSRKIALALYDAQGTAIGNDVAWTLEEIAAAKRSGRAWSKVFSRMHAEGLIDEPSLGAVVSRAVRNWNTRAPAGGDGNGAPEARRGAFKMLSDDNRRIAEALFEGQSIGPAGKQAWSLDQVATARQNGARWADVLKRMRADGLVRARTLDRVIRGHARLEAAARAVRKVVLTNGEGRHVVVTTRSRRRAN